MASNPPPPTEPEVETAPDPSEDDLSDLDDVLDEFNASKSSKPSTSTTTAPASAAPTSSGPGRPSQPAVEDDNEDLEATLKAGMADLISSLGSDPGMQKQFEEMMAELIAAGQAPTEGEAVEHVKSASESMPNVPEEVKEAPAGGAGGAGGKKEDSFQETIRRTMERMQASGDKATAATSSGAGGAGRMSEEQMLMEMMKSLSAGGGPTEGMGSEEDFNSMLMSMMTQLTNKEILYEPMKELHEKFPGWMESHKDSKEVSAEEMERYKEQQRLVGEIVARFERKGYSDENEKDRGYIVERMQKMQAQGSPPPDLVGDMSAAQEALGDLDAGCPTQ